MSLKYNDLGIQFRYLDDSSISVERKAAVLKEQSQNYRQARKIGLRRLQSDDASTDSFKLTYFAPPADLEEYVLTFFDVQWDLPIVDDRHAGATGQLQIVVRGRGLADFGNRCDVVSEGAVLFNAFDVGVPFRLYGPWRGIGASLSALGWAALLQSPVNEHNNSFFPARRLLGAAIDDLSKDLIARCNSGEISGEQANLEIADWIRLRIKSVPEKHEAVIANTTAWLGLSLNPPVEELFVDQPYSRRQVERLVLRYFGFTPSALARKFRAIRAASLLSEPDLTDEAESEIAGAFHDQPHMIREIRRYCGYTPSRLGGSGEPMFRQLLRVKNLDQYGGVRSIG